jgi:hypothetical protein
VYPDLKKAVLEQTRLHDAEAIYVEDHASGPQLIQELCGEGFGSLRGVKHASDKQTRMVAGSLTIRDRLEARRGRLSDPLNSALRRLRKLEQADDRRIAPPSLQVRDVLLRKAGPLRELFLRQSSLKTQLAHIPPDQPPHIHDIFMTSMRQR